GIAGLVAIVATLLDTASRVAINPFNFFGYFTTQSNILTAFVFLAAAGATFAGRAQSRALLYSRAAVTTYIVIVGIVYNTLLAGTEGGISLEWANWVLHVAIPIYAALDWILFADRPALAWKRIWIVLVYPIVWIIVILIRGATDGFVPYPFLNPAQGYGVVAGYCIAIAVAVIVVAAGVWAVSRLRILKA
ncbi:MAG: Pr6Pr family membrane protein, partial [Rhodoglobus sp.]